MSGISFVVKYGSASLCAWAHTAVTMKTAIIISFFIIRIFNVNILELNLETGFENGCAIIIKATAIGNLGP